MIYRHNDILEIDIILYNDIIKISNDYVYVVDNIENIINIKHKDDKNYIFYDYPIFKNNHHIKFLKFKAILNHSKLNSPNLDMFSPIGNSSNVPVKTTLPNISSLGGTSYINLKYTPTPTYATQYPIYLLQYRILT